MDKDREVKKVLAHIGMTGSGYDFFKESEAICQALDSDAHFEEVVLCIRSFCLMNSAKFEEALALLEPKAEEFESLMCYVILAASKLKLASKVDIWLSRAMNSKDEAVKSFAKEYKEAA